MFLNDLKKIYQENKDKNPLFLRILLKERIQYFVLDFISKSKWSEYLIFKGGTCLRIFFELPRLSEDLDFDIENQQNFNLQLFIADLTNYFKKSWQFSAINIKLANNKRTVYLKFPILTEIGIPVYKGQSNILFLRIDFAKTIGTSYITQIDTKLIFAFSLAIRRYSLPDLFAGKISAILTREALEGKVKKERFKGRDYYDLIWFLQRKVKPNWKYLQDLTGLKKQAVVAKLTKKVRSLKPETLESDLKLFIENEVFIKNFAKNFPAIFQNYFNLVK